MNEILKFLKKIKKISNFWAVKRMSKIQDRGKNKSVRRSRIPSHSNFQKRIE